MSTVNLLRWFFAGFLSLMISTILFFRMDKEDSLEHPRSKPRYLPLLPSQLLPTVLTTAVVLLLWGAGPARTTEYMIAICFPIFLHICFYQLVLLLLLPLLRRWFSARACAILWLLPNYLYLTQQAPFLNETPRWVWQVSSTAVRTGFFVWLAGAAAVLLWYIGSHLVFRRSLLQTARDAADPELLHLWQNAQRYAQVKKPNYRLMISPQLDTPLSIGLFRRTIRVVLPDRTYSEKELELIFRHELVHIGREDSGAKFFLVFCTAMCWFNPLMWVARVKSAEDLELSCDETVLLGCDDATRRRYAALLLNTAGEHRGFTTCLSASAKALRHRLKHVVHPRRQLKGALLIGLCFFILILSCGQVALAYEVGSGRDLIFENQSLNYFAVNSVSIRENRGYTFYQCTDTEALLRFFCDLNLNHVTGQYTQTDEEQLIMTLVQGPDGVIGLNLTERTLRITRLYEDSPNSVTYHLREPVDLQTLYPYLQKAAVKNDADTTPPNLMLYFGEEINPFGELMHASKEVAQKLENGQPVSGPFLQEEGIGGVYGLLPDKVELIFSIEPAEPFTITVTHPDGSETVRSSEDLADFYVLILEDHSALYTIHAAFEPTDELRYEMIYRFEVRSEEN